MMKTKKKKFKLPFFECEVCGEQRQTSEEMDEHMGEYHYVQVEEY